MTLFLQATEGIDISSIASLVLLNYSSNILFHADGPRVKA